MKKRKITFTLLITAALLITGCGRERQTSDKQHQMSYAQRQSEKEKSESPKKLTMPITFINNTGVDIYFLYASSAETDDWEEDILDIDIFKYGEAFQVDFSYPDNQTKWDFRIEDEEGNGLEFYDMDFEDYDSAGASITLNGDGTADITENASVYSLPDIPLSSEDLYEPILSQYYDLLKNGATADEFQEKTESDLIFDYNLDLNLDSIGYAFFDIDEDGTDELFVGCVQGGALSPDGPITHGILIDAYHINTENMIESIACSNRSLYYYLCTDGLIGEYESHIPFSESYSFYQLYGGKGLYSASGVIINDSEEGWYVVTEGNRENLSYDEAYQLINSHIPMQIIYTPFSEYQQ